MMIIIATKNSDDITDLSELRRKNVRKLFVPVRLIGFSFKSLRKARFDTRTKYRSLLVTVNSRNDRIGLTIVLYI